MMSRRLRYGEKVFDLSPHVARVQDRRPRPQIPTVTVWMSAWMMFVTRLGSLHALESLVRRRRLLGRLGSSPPSADTIGRVLSLISPPSLGAMLTAMVRRLGRNKALESPWPLRFAAVDAHELFRFPPPPL